VLFALFLPLIWTLVPTLVTGITGDGIGTVDPAGLAVYFAPGVLLAMTTGPLGEEAGWRGFLLPRMLSRYSPLLTSLIIGLIWSAWHYPLYWDSVFADPITAASFTVGTVCFSVLMTVLWGFTRASVFWAIIFHWSVNISGRVVAGVFPDIPPLDPRSLWEPAIMIVVTVGVYLLVGRERLQEKLAEAMGTLQDESIEEDRS
jgi:membrane protease YdiL (CAAX protease family)